MFVPQPPVTGLSAGATVLGATVMVAAELETSLCLLGRHNTCEVKTFFFKNCKTYFMGMNV